MSLSNLSGEEVRKKQKAGLLRPQEGYAILPLPEGSEGVWQASPRAFHCSDQGQTQK